MGLRRAAAADDYRTGHVLAAERGQDRANRGGEESTLTLTASNTGKSTAYAAKLDLTVTNGVYLTSIGQSSNAGDPIMRLSDTHFVWDMSSVPVGQSRTLTFKLGSLNTTSVTTAVYVNANLQQYSSLPDGEEKSINRFRLTKSE
ncbi:DUF11 domain-containing protein [Paenibacillus sp. P26]|nr:DUF11 domain-containing protein [Paenibacillus sp. P26]UUZ97497.1 DUF11 domain-containing protein [Paenibacillus sp. P25]